MISPDELAGLSLEESIESRIITQQEDSKEPYKLEQGPFKPERYETLGDSNWSLLVQGVDRVHPEVSMLKDSFNFIPNWRLDDVMISYATDKGSVGPHIDNYDVFLIQVTKREGKFHLRNRWKMISLKILISEFLKNLMKPTAIF